MKHYTFKYDGWIASSKELGTDWFTINSDTIEKAWEKVRRMKLFAKAVVTLESINGVKVEESLRAMPILEDETPVVPIHIPTDTLSLEPENDTEDLAEELAEELPEELNAEEFNSVFVEVDNPE